MKEHKVTRKAATWLFIVKKGTKSVPLPKFTGIYLNKISCCWIIDDFRLIRSKAVFFWETTALSQPGERISKKMTEQLRVFSWWANRIAKGQKLSPQLYVSIIFPLLLLSLVTQGAKYSQKKPYCIYPSVFLVTWLNICLQNDFQRTNAKLRSGRIEKSLTLVC